MTSFLRPASCQKNTRAHLCRTRTFPVGRVSTCTPVIPFECLRHSSNPFRVGSITRCLSQYPSNAQLRTWRRIRINQILPHPSAGMGVSSDKTYYWGTHPSHSFQRINVIDGCTLLTIHQSISSQSDATALQINVVQWHAHTYINCSL